MRIKFKNFLDTIESFIRSDATAARVYQFPNKDITVAGLDDVQVVQDDVDDINIALQDKADLVAGKVPSSQLPAYVDDVVAVANFAALPATGTEGLIYITLDNNHQFRWTDDGDIYVDITGGVALGTTSSTAHRGDQGNTAYLHSQDITTNPHGVTKSQVGLGNADNTSDANKPVSSATQIQLDAITALLAASVPVSISAATSLSASAFGKIHIITGISSDYTVDLPTAVGNTGKSIILKGAAALTKNITIQGVSGQLIDGESDRKLNTSGSFTLMSDGANWMVINEVGSWVDFTTTPGGYSVNPTYSRVAYFRVGKMCTVEITISGSGTSSATTTTTTLPFNAADITYANTTLVINGGTVQAAAGLSITRVGQNTIDMYRTNDTGTAWSNSGLKRGGTLKMTYRIQ